MKNDTAIIYCRVSTEPQKIKGLSLDTQEADGRAAAKLLGAEVFHVAKENFTGALYYERDVFRGVLKDIREGRATLVICSAVDRLSRDQEHVQRIARHIHEAGGALYIIGLGFVSLDADGKFRLGIDAYFAEKERERIRKRCMDGRRTRLSKGLLHRAGCNLYGYVRNEKGTARLKNEEEARIVRRIFEWTAVDGLGARNIARRLNEEGIPPPSLGKKAFRDGRWARWGKSTIDRIIKEPAYKGVTIGWRWKSAGKRTKVIQRPLEEQVPLPEGTTPAIVSPELWEAAQLKKAANRGETTRNERRKFLLRGFIQCVHCGRRMYPEVESGRWPKYRCSSRQIDGRPCGGKQAPALNAEEQAWQQVVEFLGNPEIVDREIARLAEIGPDEQLAVDLTTSKGRLDRVERGILKLVRRLAMDDDPEMERVFEEEVERLKKEKKELLAAIADIEERLYAQQRQLISLQAVKDVCASVRGILTEFSFEEKRLALEALGATVYANGKEVYVEVSPALLPSGTNSEAGTEDGDYGGQNQAEVDGGVLATTHSS